MVLTYLNETKIFSISVAITFAFAIISESEACMYGMVNEAIREMVIERFNISIWDEITEELNLEFKVFRPFEQYDDQVTGELIGIISKKAELDPTKLLEEFGEYWIKFALRSEYSSILEAVATSPVELIESLDSLHMRLQLTFDDLQAPSFWVTRINDNEINVHYSSQRDMPLEYFVIGLIRGIFSMFDKKCQVEMITPTNNEKGVFRVVY